MRLLARVGLALVGVVAVYVLVDFGLRFYVQNRIETEFENADDIHAEGVEFTIDSFPFVARLFLTGQVSATLHLTDVGDRRVKLDEFEVEVDGLELDRGSAFSGDVTATDVDRATVRATLTQDTLTDLFGVPINLSQNRAQVGGIEVAAQVTENGLVLTIPDIGSENIPFAANRYFPCQPSVMIRPGEVQVACTTTELPPMVNEVIGQATGR